MSATRWLPGAALAPILLILASAVYALWPDTRPNLVWITVDGLRPDRLAAYGGQLVETPSIDYLARHGAVFEQALSDSPWTGAALASTMTARFAPAHGLRTSNSRLSPEPATVAEMLRAQGYLTGAIVGSFALDRVFGFDRGFDTFDDRYDSSVQVSDKRPHVPSMFFQQIDAERTYRARKLQADSYRTDAAVADAAEAWIARASRMRPYFLWVHLFGPQRRKPRGIDPATSAQVSAEYAKAVAAADDAIGRILAELDATGVLGRTVIVLQGSFAESLGAHGELGHGGNLYDSVLRVPLVISWPGRLKGARVDALVRNLDIAPTVLDLIGLRPAAGDGRSVRALLDGGSVAEQPLLAETWIPAEATIGHFNIDGTARFPGIWRRGVRTSQWKYIRSDPTDFVNYASPPPLPPDAEKYRGEELYDLRADPGERVNVAAAHPDVIAQLRRESEAMGPLPGVPR